MFPMSFEPGTLRIGTVCPVKWSSMVGTERVRFCGKCQQKVYDLTDLPPEEIRELVHRFEGRRLCARFYARKDDRVMVRDCPLGLKLQRRWQHVITAGGVFAALALAFVFVVTLFGDLIRRQYGMTAGGVAGDDTLYVAPKPPAAESPQPRGEGNNVERPTFRGGPHGSYF